MNVLEWVWVGFAIIIAAIVLLMITIVTLSLFTTPPDND